MNKLLTVIVPSYNMEAYLGKCLESMIVGDSVLFKALDVIVVNDGSTDGTSALAHGYADRYPDVFRVIDKPNGHYGSCVNRGLAEAKGEFVKLLDADDSFDAEAFAAYLAELNRLSGRANPVDLVLSDSCFVDENGRVTEAVRCPLAPNVDLTLDDVTAMTSGRAMPAFAYRRAIFDGLGYRQTEGIAYTDTEWLFLPMTRVGCVRYVPCSVYAYLKGRAGQSTSASILSKKLLQIRKTFDVRLGQYRRFKSQWSSSAIRYAENELVSSASYLYVVYVQYGYWPFRNELRSLDCVLATDLGPCRDAVGTGYILMLGGFFKLPYGMLCARIPCSRAFLSVLFGLKRIMCLCRRSAP